jgi:hypothetical protein
MILLLSLIGVSCAAYDDTPRVKWLIEIVNQLPYSISATIEFRGGEYPLEIIPAGRMISAHISVYESSSDSVSEGIREISVFKEDGDSEEDILWMVLKGQDLNTHVIHRENTIFDFLEGKEHLTKFRLEINATLEGIGLPEE